MDGGDGRGAVRCAVVGTVAGEHLGGPVFGAGMDGRLVVVVVVLVIGVVSFT
jgi:hypothetical protein